MDYEREKSMLEILMGSDLPIDFIEAVIKAEVRFEDLPEQPAPTPGNQSPRQP